MKIPALRISLLLLAAILIGTPAFGSEPGAPNTAASNAPTLTPDDLTRLEQVTKLRQQSDTDMQTANLFLEAARAKAERAVLFEQNQKLLILAGHDLSPNEWSVELQQVQEQGQPVLRWTLVKKVPPKATVAPAPPK